MNTEKREEIFGLLHGTVATELKDRNIAKAQVMVLMELYDLLDNHFYIMRNKQ